MQTLLHTAMLVLVLAVVSSTWTMLLALEAKKPLLTALQMQLEHTTVFMQRTQELDAKVSIPDAGLSTLCCYCCCCCCI